jgi:hypothetical protein
MILHIVNVKFSPFLYNLKFVYKDKHPNVIFHLSKSIQHNYFKLGIKAILG